MFISVDHRVKRIVVGVPEADRQHLPLCGNDAWHRFGVEQRFERPAHRAVRGDGETPTGNVDPLFLPMIIDYF